MSTEVTISHRLADNRHLLYVDGVVRYVGSEEECERRARLYVQPSAPARALHDHQLGRLFR